MKNRSAFYFLVLTLAATPWLVGCPPEPVTPTPTPDSGVEPDSDEARNATCSKWCAHAAELGCSSAKPTPKGGSCTAVCENVQSSGIVRWNLVCRVKAKSCAAADVCEN